MKRDRFLAVRLAISSLSRAVSHYGKKRSLQAWLQLASYFSKKLRRIPTPLIVVIAVTHRCQCACPHCYAMARRNGHAAEMSGAEIKGVIDQIKALGVPEILFTGGDPLLREDILDLVAYARKKGMLTRISTNGYLLTRELASNLKLAGLDKCGVSIDDADPRIHDRMRGLPGIYDKAVQGLRYLRECGIETKILTYATHRNVIEGLERIIALGRKLGVRLVYIDIPRAAGRWTDSFDEVLSDAESAHLRRIQDPGFVQIEFPTPETLCCACDKEFFFINPAGEVTPCAVVPYTLGSLREEPLADIWKRHAASLKLEYRGECPMNDEKAREALRSHAESVRAGGPCGEWALGDGRG